MLSTLDSWLASVLMDLPEDMKYVPSNAVVQRDSNSPCVRPPYNQGSLSNDELPKSQFGKLLHLKLHTLLILLHRPYIADSTGASGQKPQQSRLIISRPSLDICTYASSIITHICNELSPQDLSLLAKTSSGLYALITAIRIHLMNALSTDAKMVTVGEANFERGLRLLRTISIENPGEMVLDTLYSLEQQYRSKGKQLINNAKNSPGINTSPLTESAQPTPNDPQQRMESFSVPRDRASGSPSARAHDSEESQFQFIQSKRDPATGNPKHTLPLKIIPYGPPGEATTSKQSASGSSGKDKLNGHNNAVSNGISVNGGNTSLSPQPSIQTPSSVSHNGYNASVSLTPNSSSITSTPYDVGENLNYSSSNFFPPLPDGTMPPTESMMFGHPHMTTYPDNDTMDVHMADYMMNEVDHITNMAVFAARNDSPYLLANYLHDDHMHEPSVITHTSGNHVTSALVSCHEDSHM